MTDDIFNLLMIILMLENGGSTENINQLVLMFLMMNSSAGGRLDSANRRNQPRCCDCGRDDGYTF